MKQDEPSMVSVKGMVHPKINILSSFTHPHAIPDVYDLLSSDKQKINKLGKQ